MKRHLLAALLLALPLAGHAQTAIPSSISYQGKMTDSSGVPLGNDAPLNATIVFRIYDAATGGTRLYTESHAVTLIKGEFAVLVGTGSVYNSESKPALETVFNGAGAGPERYLGITLDDTAVTNDPEIAPRQQLATTAFAFRAKVAESVASGAVTSTMIASNAIGTAQVTDSAITSSKIANLSIAADDLADAAITSAKIADGAIATADLGNGQVTAAKLATDVGVWTASGSDVLRTTGKVGIGTTTPTAMLSLGNDGGDSKLAIWDNGNQYRMGFGIGAQQFRFHVASDVDRFSFLNAQAGTEVVTITGSGKLGVYATNPAGQMTIGSPNSESRLYLQTTTTNISANDGLSLDISDASGRLWVYENRPLLLGTNNAERIRITAGGQVGFNTSNLPGDVCYNFKSHLAGGYHTIWSNSAEEWKIYFDTSGNAFKTTGTAWSTFSDRRLKENITSLGGSLDRLLSLRSVTFDYKDQKLGAGRQTGFVAQEVQEVFPDWVSTAPDGMLAVTTKGFESHTVQALRELRAEKDAQLAKLSAEKDAQIAQLMARLKDLEGEKTTAAQRLDTLEQRFNAFARTLAATGK